ncbi:MAG: glycosyltransferase family 4 protein [Anaerolineae bacterium]|nr:glycosyltransferase family 4 protein [Anaerolineae bacterium]MCB0213765.1 glycosyltransferase family 4 protein [Anaerolineae bacterium]
MKVFIVCSGLGQINRGFETFTQECFEALAEVPSLDVTLFKGGGQSRGKEIKVWNLPRNTSIAKWLGKTTGRGAYYTEQVTFTLSLLPYIQQKKPDVIFFSDGTIGNNLWHWRRLTKQPYKLLFSNGGPLSPPFSRWDHIQQVTPYQLDNALAAGEAEHRQSLVPYGIRMPAEPPTLSPAERQTTRQRLGLPPERPLILSVGAVNTSHKRMDYIIREIALLNEPRPYLLLLGQQEAESAEIVALGRRLLGQDNFQVKTVAAAAVTDYYQVADVFVLASLHEGFGRVFLEAMAHGLPCLAHDYETARYILGQEGYLADFRLTGSLANLIAQFSQENHTSVKRHQRHRRVYERFSWEKLRPSYVEMIRRCVTPVKTIASHTQIPVSF